MEAEPNLPSPSIEKIRILHTIEAADLPEDHGDSFRVSIEPNCLDLASEQSVTCLSADRLTLKTPALDIPAEADPLHHSNFAKTYPQRKPSTSSVSQKSQREHLYRDPLTFLTQAEDHHPH